MASSETVSSVMTTLATQPGSRANGDNKSAANGGYVNGSRSPVVSGGSGAYSDPPCSSAAEPSRYTARSTRYAGKRSRPLVTDTSSTANTSTCVPSNARPAHGRVAQ